MRSKRERVMFGVAGGLAEYFDIDPVLVRVAFVVLAFASFGVALLAYILLALLVPEEPSEPTDEARSLSSAEREDRSRLRRVAGGALIFIGVVVLLGELDILAAFQLDKFWPVVLIAIGLYLVLARRSGASRS
ncbi:MAG: PspC domain-containing protein [Chloroflexota bacterium]